jgi:hypothetical protein
MSLRPTYIPITLELRDTIKILKRELTYEQYLSELIKKIPESSTQSVKKPSRSIKGAKLK